MMAKGANSRKKIDQLLMESFFEFLNKKDMERLEESDLMAVLYKYTRFLCEYDWKYPFLDFRKVNDRYMALMLQRAPKAKLDQRKRFFVQLQAHLRSKLEKVLNAVESGAEEKSSQLIEMSGTRKVLIDSKDDSFVDGFWPEGIDYEGELDVVKEKVLADLALSEMIRDFDLKPSHFKRCARCDGFFYQYTAKEKKYCSTRCSNAARQAVYYKSGAEERKKKKKKK